MLNICKNPPRCDCKTAINAPLVKKILWIINSMPTSAAQIIKYGLVGVLNTAITFLVITSLTFMDVNPYLSNVIGYAAGLLNSFILNSRYTFNDASSAFAALRFGVSFSIAYLTNIVILYYLLSSSLLPEILIQFVAMISYNVAFFLLMKFWVFTRD